MRKEYLNEFDEADLYPSSPYIDEADHPTGATAAYALVAMLVVLVGVAWWLIGKALTTTPEAACKAQVVEYVRDGQRCSFVPVVSVVTGTLNNGVCVTAEVGK